MYIYIYLLYETESPNPYRSAIRPRSQQPPRATPSALFGGQVLRSGAMKISSLNADACCESRGLSAGWRLGHDC